MMISGPVPGTIPGGELTAVRGITVPGELLTTIPGSTIRGSTTPGTMIPGI